MGQGLSIFGMERAAKGGMDEKRHAPSRSLLKHLSSVADHRSSQGRRHPLGAMLALSVAAMLCGARSLYAIWQWGRMQDDETVAALGFTRAQTPAVSTLHLVFSQLDVEAFEAALRRWAQEELDQAGGAIAIDGKGLRGIHGEELPGVRLVAAYAVGAGLVLAQEGGKEGAARG
jgi:hypothetical protein